MRCKLFTSDKSYIPLTKGEPSAGRYLTALKERGEAITPKKWRSELAALIPHKDTLYEKMRAMREDIKTVEQIRKAAEQLAKTEQTNTKKHEQER